MNYTKRSLNKVVLILTIFIYVFLYLIFICSLQIFSISKKDVYSKIIPNNLYQKTSDSRYFTLKKENEGQSIDIKRDEIQVSKNNNIDSNGKEFFEKKIIQAKNGNTNKTERKVINENKEKTWRIKIPKINLDAHILEGVEQQTLLRAVGHFNNSSKWDGNVCLAAHNRGYNCNFFKNIKNLKIGDEIIYLINGKKKIYKVISNKIISETDWRDLDDKHKNCITLITCEENRRENRRCVQACAISENNI